MDALKRCSRCGESFPVDDFPVDRSHRDGRDSWCYECKRAWDRAYYVRNRDEILARDRAAYARKRESEE
jgi:hypothetical protein